MNRQENSLLLDKLLPNINCDRNTKRLRVKSRKSTTVCQTYKKPMLLLALISLAKMNIESRLLGIPIAEEAMRKLLLMSELSLFRYCAYV